MKNVGFTISVKTSDIYFVIYEKVSFGSCIGIISDYRESLNVPGIQLDRGLKTKLKDYGKDS